MPDKWPARAKPHQSLRMECHARSVAPVSAGRPFPAESAPAAHFDASRGRAAKGCHCRSRWQARRGRRRGSTRRRVPPGFARDSLLEQRRFELTVPPPCRDAGGLARRKESPRGDRVQPHGSLLTRRWRKGDSNSWSHPERQRSEGATWVPPLSRFRSRALLRSAKTGTGGRFARTRAAFIHRKNDDNATIRRWPSHHA